MNRLDHLIYAARKRASHIADTSNLSQLEEIALQHSPRGFRNALHAAAQKGPAIIAELKRASPSHGLIRNEFSVGTLAHEVTQCGAVALSILTEEHFFGGSLADLKMASSVSRLPCLRKDFIVDEAQIIEARAYRADAVLLILAALSNSEFRALLAMTRALELDAVCEVHNPRDLERALAESVDMVSVNSRNLRDFSINYKAFELVARIPTSVLAIAESGIAAGSEIRHLRDAGYHAFLIGQTLMESPSPGDQLKKLLAETAYPPAVSKQAMEKGA
jgi:indole-3-glycerol phosphate synthase